MKTKWFVVSTLAVLACFTIPHPGEAEGPSLSRGKETFEKRCGGCHSLDRDKEGPRLRGVYGRPSGSVSSFNYSPPLKTAHISWNGDALHNLFTHPDKLRPSSHLSLNAHKPNVRPATTTS